MSIEVLLPHITVTLNEGQGLTNWYQTTQFSSVYHHTKFERNQSVNIRMQGNAKDFFHEVTLVRFSPLNTEKIR